MKISIVTSTYNAERFLQKCIDSVRVQKYHNFEFLVIDGGSNDSTLQIIKNNLDIISYYVSERDTGIYNAWNKGVMASTGDWIMFLGADDELLPSCLVDYSKFIEEHNKSAMEYISAKVIFESISGRKIKEVGELWCWKKFRKYMNVAHVASLHSRDLFQKHGPFDETFKIVGDYELMLRSQDKLKAAFMNNTVAIMRDGGVSNNPRKVFLETFHAKRKNKSRNYFLCITDYIIAWSKYLIKRSIQR